ncbi:PhzF family phenazine biosynthesis protein [Pseudomonas sp. P2758]|uniref:PhzF family phenazine biosynthesis protein n=1 Tax=Pseudomonas sp. P2758 TaxID=3409916 RepID=UPI003B5AF2F3
MPVSLLFEQVDVFSEQSFKGNAVAVVIGADDLTSQQMHDFAAWTQLSETTFLLKPNSPEAHYRVRIFTPLRELPFAGHPTLGSCHVWLNQSGGNVDKEIIQECLAGLIRIRRNGAFLSFAAPPLVRSGAVGGDVLRQIESGLGLSCDQILASQWVDNGPGWVAVMMASRDDVLAIRPDYLKLNGLNVGVVAPWQGPHADADVEVRAFMGEELNEDPVNGSLNASLAQWLISTGVMPDHYTASQGTALGRQGRIKIEKIGSDIWVGGEVQLGMSGRVMF